MQPGFNCKPKGRLGEYVLAALFIAVWGVVLWYFRAASIYEHHFFDTRYTAPYNVLRVVYAAFFAWIMYSTGNWVLTRKWALEAYTPYERFALCFFTGACLWTVVLLLAGYCYLYTWGVAAGATSLVVIVSARQAVSALRSCRPTHATFPEAILKVATLVAALWLLITKGLYPLGGHDYFTHYFYFYQTVIDRHNIWPNEVWYHYYYSKAMGLFFLSMLLTDPMAPSLVTYCFAVAVACALFSLLRRMHEGTLWPQVAVMLYFLLYIPTFARGIYRGNGGWGDFQKPHEINAALLMAVLWASIRLSDPKDPAQRMWLCMGALCAFTTAFVETISFAVLEPFLLLLSVSALLSRKPEPAKSFFTFSLVAALGFTLVVMLNYATTGLPLDVGINLSWPLLNLARLKARGVLTEVLSVEHVRAIFWHHKMPLLSLEGFQFLRAVLHLDQLQWLFTVTLVAGAICWALNLLGRNQGGHTPAYILRVFLLAAVAVLAVVISLALLMFARCIDCSVALAEYQPQVIRFLGALCTGLAWLATLTWLKKHPLDPAATSLWVRTHTLTEPMVRTAFVLAAFLLATTVFVAFAGITEPVSCVRYASFTLPAMLAALMGVWQIVFVPPTENAAVRRVFRDAAPLLLCAMVVVIQVSTERDALQKITGSALRFASGSYSIYDGYKDQSGWPGREPWGAIYPGMEEAWKQVGPNTRIWSFQPWTYCMLPHCQMETYHSFIASTDEDSVLYETAEDEQRALQVAGLNYFFITWERGMRDSLHCTPLFTPDAIGKSLGILWTDGTSTLLTWRTPQTTDVSPQWVAKYRHAVDKAICDMTGEDIRNGYHLVQQGKRWGVEVPAPK